MTVARIIVLADTTEAASKLDKVVNEGANMDCPEIDSPICDACRFELVVLDELAEIEEALVFATDCGALRKRPNSPANDAIGYALTVVDGLRRLFDSSDE